VKILFINKTYQSGGAAIAARQISESIKKQGVHVSFLVQEELDHPIDGVISTCSGFYGKLKQMGLFILERLLFLSSEKSKRLRYAFSPAYTGENISRNTLVEECDVIHIHWFNQGFISLRGLEKLVKLGKPVVWTLHDMWAFTGGCHYVWDCENYKTKCGDCQFLKNGNSNDLSHLMWKEKSSIYKEGKLFFTPVSKWLGAIVNQSSLGASIPQRVIYNPVNTDLFKALDKQEARESLGLIKDEKYILFGASRVDDQIKGIKYLIDAVKVLNRSVKVVVFGGKPKFDHAVLDEFSVELIYLGHVAKSEQAVVYSACDVTCVPSEYETFGLVAAESMACETPVVAFDNSGVAEVVDHFENGYLAKHRSAEDLARGLNWVLDHQAIDQLGVKARSKVLSAFSEESIGRHYLHWYNEVLKLKGNSNG